MRVLRFKVMADRREISEIKMVMKTLTARASSSALQGCMDDLLRNHTGRPLFRRVKLLEAYTMLFDAFDQHTADHHYMEICNYLVYKGDGVEVHPATMFEVMAQCRAGGAVGGERYP